MNLAPGRHAGLHWKPGVAARQRKDAELAGQLIERDPVRAKAEIRDVEDVSRATLAMEAWTGEDPLTERERQVLRLAGEGLTGAAIAERLHLSEGTVRNYLSEAIGKLGAGNRIEAARIARRQGWL